MDSEASASLDPQLAGLLRTGRVADLPRWHEMGVAEARRVEDEVFSAGDGPAVGRVTDRTVAGPSGDLPVRVYRPPSSETADADASLPGIVFYHGGGWVLGTLDSADDLCRALAARTGAVVVSVDYRLAPEHPFPAAVEDAWTGLAWIRERAASLGVDPGRIAVAGTSAGGGLAAAVALMARESDPNPDGLSAPDDGPSLAGQVLCYPMVDTDSDRPSYREHADAPLLSRRDVEWFWDRYLGDDTDRSDRLDPLAAPLRADGLAGLPPAVVVTAGHDVLRSEGVAYARRSLAADVPTRHFHYPNLAHGFLSLADEVDRANVAMDDIAGAVRRLLDAEAGS